MMLLIQTVAAGIGVIVTGLLAQYVLGDSPNSVPWPIYAGAGFLFGYAATWLYARWKFGKGISITLSRRVD